MNNDTNKQNGNCSRSYARNICNSHGIYCDRCNTKMVTFKCGNCDRLMCRKHWLRHRHIASAEYMPFAEGDCFVCKMIAKKATK